MTLHKQSNSKFYISPESNIRDAFSQFKAVGINCLIVVKESQFLGTITDGDIRKALLKDGNMRTPIKNIYQKNAFFINAEDMDEHQKIKKAFIKNHFSLIPVIDSSENIIKVITWFDFFGKKEVTQKIKVPIVIMAGGKGTRMAPFTNVLPKPLIPINNKTVIERIIDSFHKHGKNDVYISINFKGAILKAYFQELNPNYNVSFIKELKPLGTAGALSKLKKKIENSFFLTNCDVLFDLDYKDVLDHHHKTNSLITLVASAKEITIPYGSLQTSEDGYLANFQEKPVLDYLINCGLYVIHPDALRFIPNNEYFDITDLISILLKKNYQVGVYPINDNQWVDVGQWEEYKKAVSQIT
tara:strand:- start:3843 stop:4910 length:1068 start_codon:yes stop_codon:yes gene_type:complete